MMRPTAETHKKFEIEVVKTSNVEVWVPLSALTAENIKEWNDSLWRIDAEGRDIAVFAAERAAEDGYNTAWDGTGVIYHHHNGIPNKDSFMARVTDEEVESNIERG